ncbi:MAG: hypothetical protein BGO32_09355 [Bacteroidetes bacterium 37-13]|nr:MAG: hypothetical protein BGO32_09355 [Bacteroidetes bacterium 37-13]
MLKNLGRFPTVHFLKWSAKLIEVFKNTIVKAKKLIKFFRSGVFASSSALRNMSNSGYLLIFFTTQSNS